MRGQILSGKILVIDLGRGREGERKVGHFVRPLSPFCENRVRVFPLK
jgi:hypothetical protein